MQTKERKASIVILICIGLIILIILLASMGVVLFGEEKHYSIHEPVDPTIVVDSENNVHIIWGAGDYEEFPTAMTHYIKLSSNGDILINNTGISSYEIRPAAGIDSNDNIHIIFHYSEYLKIDDQGTLLAKKDFLTTKGNVDFNIAIDSNNSIHCTWLGWGYDTYYAKLDNNGTLLNAIRLSNSSTSVQTGTDSGGQPKVVIDSKNNIHVTWTDTRGGVFYSMLDNNGTILRDQWQITNLTESNIAIRNSCLVVDSNDNLYFLYEKYQYEYSYALSFRGNLKGTFVTKMDSNGTIIFEKEIDMKVVEDGIVYSDDSIGIVGTSSVTKFDKDMNVVAGPLKLNHSFFHFNADVMIDSNDNVHVVGHRIEFYLVPGQRQDYTLRLYTVYYSKWDKDLNPLINDMVIDTDGTYKEEKFPFNFILSTLLVISILITMIWAVGVLVRSKKRK